MGRYSEALQKIEEERKQKGLEPFGSPSGKKLLGLKNYAIGMAAVSIVVLVLVYAHGIQKGKESVSPSVQTSGSNSPLNEMAAAEGNSALLENLDRLMKVPDQTKPDVPIPTSDPLKTDFYTIQLVSYQSVERAREEALKLNEKGYHAIILRSGKYQAVSIDKFDDKARATRRLNELRSALGSTYPGALVRFVKVKTPSTPAKTV